MNKKILPIFGISTLSLGAAFVALSLKQETKVAKASNSAYEVTYTEGTITSGQASNLLDGDLSTGIGFSNAGYVEIMRTDRANFLPKSVKLVFPKEAEVISTGRIRQFVSGEGSHDYYFWNIDDEATDDYKVVTVNFQYTKTYSFLRSDTPVSCQNLQFMLDDPGKIQEIIISEAESDDLVRYDVNVDALAPFKEAEDHHAFNGIAALFDGNEKTAIRFHKNAGEDAYFDVDLKVATTVEDVTLSLPTGSESVQISPDAVEILYSNDNNTFTPVLLNDANKLLTRNTMTNGTGELRRYLVLENPQTARYWRISVGTENTAWGSLSEIQFNFLKDHPIIWACRIDGATEVLPSTGNRTGSYGCLFDNDPTTYIWFQNNLGFVSVTYHEDITVSGFAILVGNGSGDHFSGKVEYFDETESKWATAGTFPYSLESTVVKFSSPITASRFRIAATNGSGEYSNVGTWAAVREFQLFQDIQFEGNWTIPYQNIYQNISHITDGDFSTSAWFDFKIGYEASMILNLKETTQIKDILLFQQGKTSSVRDGVPSTFNTDYLHNYKFGYSLDGNNWTDLDSFVDTIDNIYILSSPVNAKYIRIMNLDDTFQDSSSTGAVIREFRVNALADFVDSFNTNVVCDDGFTAPLISGWETAKKVFEELEFEIKDYVSEHNVGLDPLGLLLEKYEYIVKKYSSAVYTEYIGRTALASYANVGSIALANNTNTNIVLIIIVSALISVTAFALFFKVKRKGN